MAVLETMQDGLRCLMASTESIAKECNSVLGSELHYQAMIYACLRNAGAVPVTQIGMNVKQHITPVHSPLFRRLEAAKHEQYRDGFETIPDVVLFKPSIHADWRRRNHKATLVNMLMAIEVKASERAKARLRPGEIVFDIDKLVAHRQEVRHLGADFVPVMLVIDTAPFESERMTDDARAQVLAHAQANDVILVYASPLDHIVRVPSCWQI